MKIYLDSSEKRWILRSEFSDGRVEGYPCDKEGVSTGGMQILYMKDLTEQIEV
jgi:hypothetical protein